MVSRETHPEICNSCQASGDACDAELAEQSEQKMRECLQEEPLLGTIMFLTGNPEPCQDPDVEKMPASTQARRCSRLLLAGCKTVCVCVCARTGSSGRRRVPAVFVRTMRNVQRMLQGLGLSWRRPLFLLGFGFNGFPW